MTDYKNMYSILFNKLTDVIDQLQEVQKLTEEMYINTSSDFLQIYENTREEEI